MDDGDPVVPMQFSCEACGGEMYPEYYKGGYEYCTRRPDIGIKRWKVSREVAWRKWMWSGKT
jgi:hypothetical protein